MRSVFCSGTYDLLHSGHVTFFKRAAEYGDLYVGIGNDASIEKFKGKKPVCNQDERLFMVESIKYVKGCWINEGEGQLDFIDDLIDNDFIPDIMIVNEDQDIPAKQHFCKKYGIEYIVLKRTQEPGLPARSTTKLRQIIF